MSACTPITERFQTLSDLRSMDTLLDGKKIWMEKFVNVA